MQEKHGVDFSSSWYRSLIDHYCQFAVERHKDVNVHQLIPFGSSAQYRCLSLKCSSFKVFHERSAGVRVDVKESDEKRRKIFGWQSKCIHFKLISSMSQLQRRRQWQLGEEERKRIFGIHALLKSKRKKKKMRHVKLFLSLIVIYSSFMQGWTPVGLLRERSQWISSGLCGRMARLTGDVEFDR